MTKTKIPTEKLTYQEFLQWCDEDTRAEWVNGEVIVLAPASDRHQDLSDFLAFIMRAFSEARGLGIIRSAPFQMKTGHELPGREPDILFIAKDHRDRLKENRLQGPADLVVEITSPESRLRDRGAKFGEYELGGITEYWLIDLEREEADFYRLDERGRYRPLDPDKKGIYHSQVISGFWLKVDWLWQEPLPPVLDILRELGLL